MSNIEEELISYFEEAHKYNYPSCCIKMDLRNILDNYENEIREDERENVLFEIKDKAERAMGSFENFYSVVFDD